MRLIIPQFFLASLLSVGQICGSLLTALICDEFGRKAFALSSCLPALIGWICLGKFIKNLL